MAITISANWKQVNAGLDYLEEQAKINLDMANKLLAATKSGNIDKAKNAYTMARPYYERVEVLANSFEDIDA